MPSREQKLAGRLLRYQLALLLFETQRPMTVAELAVALSSLGHVPPGRPSKLVSDALRWEVRRGRVRRLGRNGYATGRIPESTRRWMRRSLEEHGCAGSAAL